jgi:hypothetical protein
MAAPWIMSRWNIPAEYERHVDSFLSLASEKNLSEEAINTALEFASVYRGEGTPEDIITGYENFASAKGIAEPMRDHVLGWWETAATNGPPAPGPITEDQIQTDSELRIELEGLMVDQRSSYWRGANSVKLQNLYHDILERSERGVNLIASNKAAEKTNASISRMAAIEGMMGDKKSEYWRGEKSTGLQKEYLQLIEQRDAPPDRQTNESFNQTPQQPAAQAATEGIKQ